MSNKNVIHFLRWLGTPNDVLVENKIYSPEEVVLKLYNLGTKFYVKGDKRPCYIVNIFDDNHQLNDSSKKIMVVVYKQYDKHEQAWQYTATDAGSFLMEQYHATDEWSNKKIPLMKIFNVICSQVLFFME